MSLAAPLLSVAAPLINEGSLAGVLPNDLVQKGKNALADISQKGGMGMGGKVQDLISNLRGGLVGKSIPGVDGLMEKAGVAGLGSELFPNGFKMPGNMDMSGSLNRLKRDVGQLM
jgi:hypothetical protein